MNRWNVVTLGEVATVIAGSTPKTSIDEYWNGKYNWVTPAELNDTTYIIYETERKITEKAIIDTSLKPLPIGTVLLSSRAPIGKVAITGVEMYCNQGFKNLICSDRIYNKYLFWYLKGKTEFLNSLGRGATFKEISKTIVENIRIPLPPLDTQKQIAKTLDTAAELLKMRKQQLAELDNLIKSTFYDMFGDIEYNINSWDIISFSSIVKEFRYGTSVKSSYDQVGYPILRIPNVVGGTIILDDLQYNNTSDIEYQRLKLKENDLLFVRSNGNKEYTGRSTLVRKEYEGFVYASYLIRARIDTEKVDLNFKYLSELLKTDSILKQLKSKSKTSAGQYNINTEGLGSLQIFIPPISLQNQFAEIVTKIEEQKNLVKKAIDETQYLFDSLMSEYFD